MTPQAAAALAGNFYVNIHSAGCGSGEIRGQLVLGPIIPTLSGTGLIAFGLLLSGAMAFAIWRRSAMSA